MLINFDKIVINWNIRGSYRSEGFPLAAYLVPGRDGMGAWPNSKIVQEADASSMTNTSKIHKSSTNKKSTIGPYKND